MGSVIEHESPDIGRLGWFVSQNGCFNPATLDPTDTYKDVSYSMFVLV